MWAWALLVLLSLPRAAAAEGLTPDQPLAGWSNEMPFLRSPDNSFVLFPSGRLQIDGYFFRRESASMPTDTVLLRRVRLEAYGWVGPWLYFNLAGDFALGPPAAADPVAQSWIATTDNFVMIAPRENLVMLQVGQFDAPFTLENRTSDKYFDFLERSITVRTFGVPSNKEVGAMVHGLPPSKRFYYSLGVFNGDGQNFRNVDDNADVMGRAWVAPLRLGAGGRLGKLEDAEVGGSFWLGQRGGNGLRQNTLTTQGGFAFMESRWSAPNMAKTPMELHQHHDLRAWALELNLPVAHRYGLRIEYVNKTQDLDEDDISMTAAGKLTTLGHAKLDGWSMYGQIWYWILGDDTILPEPGLQLPPRLKKFAVAAPRHGLMVALRIDHLEVGVASDTAGLGDPAIGRTEITAIDLGLNYWYSKRFRASVNYVVNVLDGDSESVQAAQQLNGRNSDEHEVLARLAIAL